MTREQKIAHLRRMADSVKRSAEEDRLQGEALDAAGLLSAGFRESADAGERRAAAYLDHAMRLACEAPE